MTLLGKIFRPWDLAANESFATKSSENVASQAVALDTKRKSSRGEGSPKLASSPGRESSSETNSSESDKRPMSSVTDGGASDHQPHHVPHFLELSSNISSYYFPSSPVTPTSSSSFMTSSSINELASLSRSELTAMGLLPPEPPASLKVKRQRPKRFRCPHCQVAFSNNGQLRGHIRIHTGERPFACEHEGCGKSFTRNEELTRHRRIHTGLRPYPCTHCGKKFGRKDHLKKHTRTHQRPVYSAASGMIGLGNPFHPFNPSLVPSHSAITELASVAAPYGLPFMLSIPPPISHFPFS